MHKLGRDAVAAATVAVWAMGLGARTGHAAPNIGNWEPHVRADPPAALGTGIGPVGVIGVHILAPPVAALATFPVALVVADTGSEDDGSLYAILPFVFGVVVGLSTCLTGLASDGGKGNCPLVVLAAAGSSLALMGLAVAAKSPEPLLLAVFVPTTAGVITYNVTAAEGAAPSVIVPSHANLQRAPLVFPLFQTSF